MTETQFRNSDEFREKLKVLLNDPTMKLALEIVEAKAKPRGEPEPKPNAHLDTLFAKKYNKLSGIQFAVDMIRNMVEPNPIEGESDTGIEEKIPFFHTLPDPMKQAIRQQFLQNQS